jgi:hypothetical protein
VATWACKLCEKKAADVFRVCSLGSFESLSRGRRSRVLTASSIHDTKVRSTSCILHLASCVLHLRFASPSTVFPSSTVYRRFTERLLYHHPHCPHCFHCLPTPAVSMLVLNVDKQRQDRPSHQQRHMLPSHRDAWKESCIEHREKNEGKEQRGKEISRQGDNDSEKDREVSVGMWHVCFR